MSRGCSTRAEVVFDGNDRRRYFVMLIYGGLVAGCGGVSLYAGMGLWR